jgi:hypothetical protein
VNAVFLNDPSQHVFEIQLLNQQMMFVRSSCGAHHTYNSFRTAIEILEANNEPLPPTNDDALNLSDLSRNGSGSSRTRSSNINFEQIVTALSQVLSETFDEKLKPVFQRLNTIEERLMKIESCVTPVTEK